MGYIDYISEELSASILRVDVGKIKGLRLCGQAFDCLSVGVQVVGALGPVGNMTHEPLIPKLDQNFAARGFKIPCVANRPSALREAFLLL